MRLFSYRKAFIVKQHEQELNTTPETAEEEQDEQYVLERHKVPVKAWLVLVMSETRQRSLFTSFTNKSTCPPSQLAVQKQHRHSGVLTCFKVFLKTQRSSDRIIDSSGSWTLSQHRDRFIWEGPPPPPVLLLRWMDLPAESVMRD